MINFWSEDGSFIAPAAARKRPIGAQVATYLRLYKCRTFIPFSSFHRYQRADSAWANAYTTPLSAYAVGFPPDAGELLPAHVRIDCESGAVSEIRPDASPDATLPPEAFGDSWADLLERDERRLLTDYFARRQHVWRHYGWLNFRVGRQDNLLPMGGPKGRGLTFETPRASLVAALRHEVFDDLLIGNFMRVTVHGDASLYPDFTPYVAKYADNGRAYTDDDLSAYMAHYRRRAPVDFMRHRFEEKTEQIFRRFVSRDSPMFGVAKRIYVAMKT
ncbi:MAG: hypothetical protein ACREEW_03085 [Caulobacteraceae bacterium]